MATRGYILLETGFGRAKNVAEQINQKVFEGVKVVAIDTVTGPYDIIIHLESEDLNKWLTNVRNGVREIKGIERVTFCLAVNLL